MLKIDKESLNEKLLRSEEKLNDSEMNTNSLKQQILNMQCNSNNIYILAHRLTKAYGCENPVGFHIRNKIFGSSCAGDSDR